ncbi:hypothetical protein HGB47_20075 [Leptospira yasudae]|uniref:hypothetical protein n=1 Tax=Leptospira yasudae TaxID=2202201 RepID=UPI001C501D36|nr:hypothetical protein [Leptospira yasudae]MBW0435908.1 hypothetical protein [Leptospira yasudae]
MNHYYRQLIHILLFLQSCSMLSQTSASNFPSKQCFLKISNKDLQILERIEASMHNEASLAIDYYNDSGRYVALINKNWEYLWDLNLQKELLLIRDSDIIRSNSNSYIKISDEIFEINGCTIEKMIVINRDGEISNVAPFRKEGYISYLEYFLLFGLKGKSVINDIKLIRKGKVLNITFPIDLK